MLDTARPNGIIAITGFAMTRRTRVDSTTAAVAVMQASLRSIVPPAHIPLDDAALPFWDSVVAQFARSEWTAHDLEIAAMLARTMRDVSANQELLALEGAVLASERGTPVINPRATYLNTLVGTMEKLRRGLQVDARARNGEKRDTGARRDATKSIEASNPLDDELLARPVLN
jgi:hypothetical protein